jgi:uncharacterized protein (TIGR00369 family)
MQTQDPDFRAKTLAALTDQPFADLLGMEALDAGPGWITVGLDITPRHTQHDGIVHGGVAATLADTGAALAALTLVRPGERVVTVEFKINFLRPARAGRLVCRGQVLRPGRSVTVSESDVTEIQGDTQTLIAKAMATIAILPAASDKETGRATA